jgi:outer membrane protein TolC
MGRRAGLFVLLCQVAALTTVNAQLTIDYCYQKAHDNYPLIRQYDLIRQSAAYTMSSIALNYLPQLQLSAKATYQSDVPKLEINIPDYAAKIIYDWMSPDQYSVNLEASQLIWDGGMVRAKRKQTLNEAEVAKKQLDVSLYTIRERVNQLFFAILLLEAQIEQSRLYNNQLQQQYERVEAFVSNGLANQSDLNAIKAGQIKALQMELQLNNKQRACIDMLSAFIGEPIAEDVKFVKPDTSMPNLEIKRPELSFFDAQLRNTNSKKMEINAGLTPQLALFFSGGYGRPSLNMLSNDFKWYYIGGVRFLWNIGSFYTLKNNNNTVFNSTLSIQTQQAAFLFNTNMEVKQKQHDIDNFRMLLNYDEQIIALRHAVREASEVALANGTGTVIDLLTEINNEQFAHQEKIQHEIELMQAIYNLKYALGQ